MRFFTSAVLSGLAVTALAAPSSNHVIHEKRSNMPHGWSRHTAIDKRMQLPMRIGLKQANMENAHDKLMSISDPDSKDYGSHMSYKEIIDFFKPSEESYAAVKEWLSSSGIDLSRVKHSFNQGWLEFEASVEEAENLLKTEYKQYKHSSNALHVGCEEYSVPAHVQEHIDIITPTMHFDAHVRGPSDNKFKRDLSGKKTPKLPKKIGGGPKKGKTLKPTHGNVDIIGETKCGTYITPGCLRELYKIPENGTGLNLSSFGIVEYSPITYLQSDLNDFESLAAQENYGLTTNTGGEPVGTAPIVDTIDGGYLVPASTYEGFGINGEADLDLEYAIDLVYPQSVTLYQVGDSSGAASFNNFLDGIDASYCTFEGGDDPSQDEQFPDPVAGGYNGTNQCGVWAPAKVISTSYGYNEHDLTPAYEARQCAEYLKLGLAGVSFIYSSGDYGVAGNGGHCIAANGSYNDGSSGRFNPAFPSTCPYVTSVGATEISPGKDETARETACYDVIYSGGGFSNNFALPSYQANAVGTYFSKHAPKYTSAQYNNSGMTRGFPDVSANGANYVVYVAGEASLVYGTSASAPVFGSIITLINNVRASKKKPLPSLGFLNPVFYKYPGMFNDITNGTNPGCGTQGYKAVNGWDPVTGLGTPNYNKLLSKLGSLKAVPTQ